MLVFVYGTLQSGFGLHRAIEGQQFLGNFTLIRPTTMMVGVSRHSYPALVSVPTSYLVASTVKLEAPKGELYLVDDSVVPTLDAIEGTPSFYQRTRGEVLVEAQHEEAVNKALGTRKRNVIPVSYYCMGMSSTYLDSAELVSNGLWRNPEFVGYLRQWQAEVEDHLQKVSNGERLRKPGLNHRDVEYLYNNRETKGKLRGVMFEEAVVPRRLRPRPSQWRPQVDEEL